jgi:predicted phage terminase large subunit-like protein
MELSANSKYSKLLSDYDKHCTRIAQSTSIDIHETPDAKLRRVRALEKNYVEWFEYYFPNFAKKKCAWFHRELANNIINNRRIRQLAEMYRSAGKSVHIDMGIPLFLNLAKSDLKFMLLVGETADKAAQLLSGIQSQLQFNNRLKNDYGSKFQQGSWEEGNFTTTDGIKFMSLGFGQNPRGAREQGERPDYIVVDDVDNKRHVNNDRMMREAIDYITEDVWGCFDSEDNGTERFVYANNNFHKNSITNRMRLYFLSVIQKHTEEKKDKAIERSKFPVKFNILRVCAVKNLIDFEPEWIEKTSALFWREKYNSTPYRSFMREYMHVHIEDGAIFKYEDILFTDPLKLSEYESLCMYGDLSYKANADYKALVLVGKSGMEFHVLLVYLKQKTRADAAIWLYDMYEKHNLQRVNIKYMIEGLFAMDEFVNDFNTEGTKRGYYIPVVADKKNKADKYDRIESMSGFFERNNVFFRKNGSPDQQTAIEQLLAFERGSKAHDDFPDALQSAMAYLNMRTHKSKTKSVFGRRVSMKF